MGVDLTAPHFLLGHVDVIEQGKLGIHLLQLGLIGQPVGNVPQGEIGGFPFSCFKNRDH